ncbi:MAG: gamma-glutamyltransferase [Rhodothermales bacterium]
MRSFLLLGALSVTKSIALDWEDEIGAILGHLEMIEEIDNFRETYLLDGRAHVEGDIFRNPDLAKTYELIARGGCDAFYEGEIADVLEAYMRLIGGYLRKEDLQAHTSTWGDPISVNYRGYDVYELPPNGQGIAALQMLTILEGFDLAAMGHNSAERLPLIEVVNGNRNEGEPDAGQQPHRKAGKEIINADPAHEDGEDERHDEGQQQRPEVDDGRVIGLQLLLRLPDVAHPDLTEEGAVPQKSECEAREAGDHEVVFNGAGHSDYIMPSSRSAIDANESACCC